MGLVTLTFDRLTLKLVCESHLRWKTFLPILGTRGLWVFESFAIYGRTDRQTDGRTDKSNAYCPLPYGGEGIKYVQIVIRSELIIHNNRQLRYNTIRYGVFNVQ